MASQQAGAASPTSQDDLSAPTDFQVSSSSSTSSEIYEIRSLEGREKCPVCWSLKKEFICKGCVRKGNFACKRRYGQGDYQERFVDMHRRLLELKHQRDNLMEECMAKTQSKERALVLGEEIQLFSMRVEMQKQLKENIELRLMQAAKEFQRIKQDVELKTRNAVECKRRLSKMEKQRNQNYSTLELSSEKLNEKKRSLEKSSRKRIGQLKECVFPVQEMYGESKDCKVLTDRLQSSNVTLKSGMDGWSDEEDDTVRSLMMAATISRVNHSSSMEFSAASTMFHSIAGAFGPALPVSGDYSARYLSDVGQSTSPSLRNASQIIAAGLTFLTQFVNMISFFLDLRLPHRLSYSEFSVGCMSDKKFNRKVAKLNANVVHLCVSQGIPTSYIQPRKTISNLLLLFDPTMSDHCRLGRRGYFEVAIQLAKSMEDSMEKDLVIYEDDSDDSDKEVNDYYPADWETVHRGSIPEDISQLQTMRYVNYTSGIESEYSRSRNATASMASNLISSVSSLFRGWNS